MKIKIYKGYIGLSGKVARSIGKSGKVYREKWQGLSGKVARSIGKSGRPPAKDLDFIS